MKKRIISLLVSFALLLGLIQPMNVSAESVTGECGDNLTWSLDDTGALTISGTGDMWNYNSKTVPWHDSRINITSVVISQGVTNISNYAFNNCDNLTDVDLPSSLTRIGEDAFSYCDLLSHISIPNGVTYIGKSAFHFCEQLASIDLPDSLTYLGNYAFAGCDSLTSISLPDNVDMIGKSTFASCTKLTDVSLPLNLTSIGESAFGSCNSLSSVVFPDTLTRIGDAAFNRCENLSVIHLPASVSSIEEWAFRECTALETIYYSGTERLWKSIELGEDNEPFLNATLIYTNDNQSLDAEHPYASIIENTIISQRDSFRTSGDGYGAVFDIDDNGTDELIMVFTAMTKTSYGDDFPAKVCSLYTISDGKVICLVDKEELFLEAGGPSGHATVIRMDNNIYFAITSETGETGGDYTNRYGSWKLYTLQGTSLELVTHVTYDYYYDYYQDSVDYAQSTASFNGKAATYKEYEDWLSRIEEILIVESYRYDWTTDGDGASKTLSQLLVSLLQNPIQDHNDRKLVVYSDHSTRELSIGSIMTLGAVVLSDGSPVGDAAGITFQIADPSILSVVSTYDEDQYRYVKFKGLEAGTTNVAFNDSATGSSVVVPITVFENRFHSYTLSNVPTQQIEKYPTNFYNVNGLYVDSYEYTVNDDQSATISFDVYNTNYSYGTVEVFDENGNLKDAVLIDKMTSSNTGFKEAVLDNLGYLVRDIFQGDLCSYRQESGFSKMTSVRVKVPKNGYITICMDPEESSVVGLVNYADLLFSMLDLTGEITGFSAKSKEFSGKLTAKIVNEKIFAELVSDSDKMTQKLWKNIGKEALVTSESMGNFVDTAIRNLSEFGLLDIIRSTASDCGWSIGEKVFTDLAGPFGMALKVMFTVGKAENIIIQHHDVTHLAGCGCIVIQNQGGGIRSCQQIKVEKEDGFDDDTALNVFSVTLEADLLDLVEKYSPEIYDQIVDGITYTYNISLMKDGNETQPDGEVTVYIPIPDELKGLAYAGELTDGNMPVNIKIYRVEEDGSLTEMVVRVEDGCFVFTTDHFSLYTIVGLEEFVNPFTDVPKGSFYYNPVMWAVEKGITNGATATTFNPGGTCLRAQVVTFLHRAAGNPEPTSTKNPFTDVKSGDFFYEPVLWAVEKGITNGTTATTFGSYANCNRAAVVTFLWRAVGSPEPSATNNPFVDVKTTDFFYKPVLWAVENGITNGIDATHFGPATYCNRAQVVTFLYRAAKINNEEIVKVASGIDFYAILKANGKVDVVSWNEIVRADWCEDWTDIVDIDANNYFILGLQKNGSVVFQGVNVSSRGEVGEWSDIKQVSAGSFFSVGLKTNGTVVAAGSNDDGECNVSDWTGIIAISAGSSHTVGLKADGTVVATGSNHMGQCDVAQWSDIIAIAAGDGITVGLKADGTVVTTCVNWYYNNPAWTDIRDAEDWTDVIAIDAGRQHIVALKSDGTVATAGFVSEDTNSWCDVAAINAGGYHTIGLKEDGTILIVQQPEGI